MHTRRLIPPGPDPARELLAVQIWPGGTGECDTPKLDKWVRDRLGGITDLASEQKKSPLKKEYYIVLLLIPTLKAEIPPS